MPQASAAAAVESFRKRYGKDPADVAFAPGRVNVIGEHTDYNDGFVLPAAVDLATYIAFAPRADGRVRFYSDMVDEEVEFDLDAKAKEGLPFWAHYPWGVGMSLLEKGLEVQGFDGYATSSVPQGGGLSSSASFEVSTALAYLGRRASKVRKLDLAVLARRAENAYVGTNCGIMDQFSSVFGTEGHAILLDCRSLKYRQVGFPQAVALVVADTGVRHVLGESGYHRRQEECAAAAGILAEAAKGVKNLRDVSILVLNRKAALLGDVLFRRTRHVVTENARVKEAADAMAAGDLKRLGALMGDSHRSLKFDYEVSCAQLDTMVDLAEGLEGHYGTRMTGGGFGGCTVSLVDSGKAGDFARELVRRYEAAAKNKSAAYIVRPGRGAGLLGLPEAAKGK